MSGFSSEWLALREPLDLAARNSEVEQAFLERLPAGAVKILDLASGAGSTVAALSEKLKRSASWLLTDYDADLLQIAAGRLQDLAATRATTRQIDLSRDMKKLPFSEVDCVTTSAFLDLTSEAFLVRLADEVTRAGKPFLASLTYDGRASFAPAHPFDAAMTDALNTHQKTDKGFGPALGPDAAARAIGLFEARGYRVVQGTSDWQIAPGSKEFLREFLSGWRRVGDERQLNAAALEDWWQDRIGKVRAGELSMTVGHVDFAALPSE